jgi:hypothetical protein
VSQHTNVAPAALVHGTLSHKLLLFSRDAASFHVPDGVVDGLHRGGYPSEFKQKRVAVLLVFHDILPVSQFFLGRGEEAFLALEQNLFAMLLQFVVPEGFCARLR